MNLAVVLKETRISDYLFRVRLAYLCDSEGSRDLTKLIRASFFPNLGPSTRELVICAETDGELCANQARAGPIPALVQVVREALSVRVLLELFNILGSFYSIWCSHTGCCMNSF